MKYPLSIPGFSDGRVELEAGGFWRGARLLLDGQPAPRGPKRGQFSLTRDDGTLAAARFKNYWILDTIPQVLVDDITYQVVPPLKWYEWTWSALPLVLAFIGGGLGGLLGGAAMVINGRIFRSSLGTVARYLLSGLISIVAVVLFLLSVGPISQAIGSLFPLPAREFSSAAGRFSVSSPYTLTENTQSIDTQVGAVELHMFSANQPTQTLIVSYSDYPAELVSKSNPDKILDGSRNGMVQNSKGQLLSETRITIDGHPGRELTVSSTADNGQELLLRSRIYLVENRLYQVTVVTIKDKANPQAIDQFLQSFKLTTP
jgi:hypothetical protein